MVQVRSKGTTALFRLAMVVASLPMLHCLAEGSPPCDPLDETCEQPCFDDSDCRQDEGFACVPLETDAAVRITSLVDDDAGAVDDDAGIATDAGAPIEDAGRATPVVDASTPAEPRPPIPRGVCSKSCRTALCPMGTVCRGGGCRTGCDRERPDCGEGRVCDFHNRRCVDEGGSCEVDRDCPDFGDEVLSQATPRCVDAACILELKRTSAIRAPFGPRGGVAIGSPEPGQRFTHEDEVLFRIDDTNGVVTTIVVMDEVPADIDDVLAMGRWGIVIDDERRSVTWAEGRAIEQRFVDRSADLPRDKALYAIAIAFTRGERVGVSEIVPFEVGDAWKSPGQHCEPGPLACKNPDIAMTCLFGRCRGLCLSDQDCRRLSGTACGDARHGFRVCE